MKRWLQIQTEPIDEASLARGRVISDQVGAVVVFLGVVRAREGAQTISGIAYEAFTRMVEFQFEKIFDDMQGRWPVESVRLIHRVGLVAVNEPSLWVEISAPHRGEAFEACQHLIEEMKRVVPIWKRPIVREG